MHFHTIKNVEKKYINAICKTLFGSRSRCIISSGGNKGMPVLPELARIQFEGFSRFVHKRLIEELENFPKIEDTDKEVEF